MAGLESYRVQPAGELDSKVLADQRLRVRRLAMSFGSYMFTFTLVAFGWYQGMLPGQVVLHYVLAVLVVLAIFLWLFLSNRNLRFSDASLTMPQIMVSLPPVLYVMYFLDAGQARGVFLLLCVVPALYGILALSMRQFLQVNAWYLLSYGVLLAVLFVRKPSTMNLSLELIQLLALALVVSQIALIGGYITGLREKLRRRNQDLNEALQKISDLASRDGLTGVFNRRHLFEVLSREANRCQRASGPFSVCILDIDHFKQVNDVYGHQAGDTVLREVAVAVATKLRNIDCFGRYGGEEFLLVLPQTSLAGAQIKADRVRQQVAELVFPDIAEGFRVTTSIGVAEYRPGENIGDTIARADAALYQAKTQGRNRVVTEGAQQGACAAGGDPVATETHPLATG